MLHILPLSNAIQVLHDSEAIFNVVITFMTWSAPLNIYIFLIENIIFLKF